MAEDDNDKPKRFKSPPYPNISLDRAIERARQLYPKALHHWVNSAVLGEAWKFGTKSSGLSQTTAAMIQFGLMTDQGMGEGRRFALTKDAIRLVQDSDPNSEKRRELIRKAALAPKIHKELWENFKGATVSDALLRNYLMFDRPKEDGAAYSAAAAEALIDEYKATILLADFRNGDISALPVGMATEQDEAKALEVSVIREQSEPASPTRSARAAKRPGMVEDVFSLKEGDVVLQWPQKLSSSSYRLLEAWAQLMLLKIKDSVAEEPAKTEEN